MKVPDKIKQMMSPMEYIKLVLGKSDDEIELINARLLEDDQPVDPDPETVH